MKEGIVLHFTQREQDKLMIVVAAEVARRRKARGLKLNHPEALALISDELLEGARDGKTVAELMSYGKTILNEEDVMDGVANMITELEIEATFPDGTKLITVHQSFKEAISMIPGEIIVKNTEIEVNKHHPETVIEVKIQAIDLYK